MSTPTQRLEERKRITECRVCAWLALLPEDERREWNKAITDRRFGSEMVANEIMAEISGNKANIYTGPTIGESSVDTHRTRGHR